MVYKFQGWSAPNVMENHLNLGGADSDGNELGLNSLYLTRNGKPYIGIMGEMHYSRVPKSQWRKALELMKEGGIQIVATYIIWIYHESEEGFFNWSGDNDLSAFIELAQEVGLEVCIRIGPWCHGEVRNGGFPDWLINKGLKLRSDDTEYLEYVRKWFTEIFYQCKGLFYKDGGPITMCQLENELTDDGPHLLTLKTMAREIGIDVPYYTVTGWNAVNGAEIPVDDVLPMFGGYVDAPWDEGVQELEPCSRYAFNGIRNDSAIGKDLIKDSESHDWQLPYDNYPYGTCEIGAGLMDTYHRRYIISGMDIYAMTLVMLGEGANILGYYMYHGGLNQVKPGYTLQESKATGYPNDYPIISYDFQAPISSYNETRESYDLLNLLHVFIKDYEDRLAPMTYVASQELVPACDYKSLRYGMRTDGDSGFVFINHYQRLHKLEDVCDVVIDTGAVQFPPIDVKGDVAFFMPFNMDLGDGAILKYATAQPLCQSGCTWLFLEIPGIKPEFEFLDEDKTASIIVLNMDEAKRLRKVDGRTFFVDELGKTVADLMEAKGEDYTLVQKSSLPFDIPDMYRTELEYGHASARYYEISVQDDKGFIDIDIKGDVMQLYVEGKLVDDDFYHGLPWRLPKRLICGQSAYIAVSDINRQIYMEQA